MKKFLIMILFIGLSKLSQAQNHEEMIEGPFETRQEITETCLTCHDGIGENVQQSRHWNWKKESKSFFYEKALKYGFRVSANSDLNSSLFNHISFSSKENANDPNNINCLICHEQSGKYSSGNISADDLLKIAQSVKKPTRKNCGTCHFDKSKGADIRHGDLDKSLINPSREIDVHIGGKNFNCTTCHTYKEHKISGADSKGVKCMNCHNEKTHKSPTLNNHIKNVACETCHITEFAKEEPTTIFVDWSKSSDKRFISSSKVKPVYLWSDGTSKYYKEGEKIGNKSIPVLVSPNGNISDPKSKITPFKVVKGKLPFDEQNQYLIAAKFSGNDGFIKTGNIQAAAQKGMTEMNLNYSGNVSFIEAEMYVSVNHMVSPKTSALKCTECHGVKGKKLLNWTELGYKSDPMRTKGRERNNLLKK